MIRFIDLGDQILEGEPQFAWFDTITDRFIELGGTQTWSSWEEFKEDYMGEKSVNAIPESWDLERFAMLFAWYKLPEAIEYRKKLKRIPFVPNVKYSPKDMMVVGVKVKTGTKEEK